MADLYPYIKHQGDLEAVVESEFKLKHGIPLSPVFINRLLKHRRTTIKKAMLKGKNVILTKLGRLVVSNTYKDRVSIKASLGEDYTHEDYSKELRKRFKNGTLMSQKYSKSTGKIRKHHLSKFQFNAVD